MINLAAAMRCGLWHSRMCMVTQITCAKSAEFCKDETLRLCLSRDSQTCKWNCTACGTCAQIGCICMESEPSVAYPDRATQTFWTPTCTAVASHTMYSSGITYYILQLLQACSFVYLWYLTCLLLPGKEGISLHTPYVPSKHDSSIQMSGTPSDLCRKGRWNYKFSSKWERLIDGRKATTQSFLPHAPMNFQRFLKISYHSPPQKLPIFFGKS